MTAVDVSVVIPLYNKGHYVERAITSVLAQKGPMVEVIVVDDGSTDSGASVVERIRDRRVILLRQANAGVSAARNRGIQEARAELVAFLDADDEWKPGFLETMIALRKRFPQAGMYACAYAQSRNNKVRISKVKEVPLSPWEGVMPGYFRSAALGDPPIHTSSVAIPREILLGVGGFPVGKRMGEDLDLWGRIALQYPVVFSWSTGGVYHQDAENRACDRFTEEDEHPFVETYRSLKREEINPTMRCDLELYVCRLQLENARQHVLIGNYRRARHLCAQIPAGKFTLRKSMWGGRWNRITRGIWEAKTMLLGKAS
ncbi:MAG: glycosyltransferase family 2 protein [Deltaproteobacteria bacterium]|nr:glycosyltransferase family 2 protein [Candidatus Deferrimicrobium borealis]